MSNSSINDEDLRRMINAAISGTLSDEEWRRLDEALCSDDDALEVYLDYCQLEVDLFFCSRAQLAGQRMLAQIDGNDVESQVVLASSSKEIAVHQRRFLKTKWLTAYATSAVLFVATACALSWVSGWQFGRAALEQSLAGSPSASASPAGYLTMASGCSWDDGATLAVHQVGSAVLAGNELALQEGIAEFRLSSGVSLSVEGPATLVITSPTSLVLHHGKLTASVPWTVNDFRLLAGGCRVTACDAEIGVVVAASNLDVHAFRGEARLSPSPFAGIRQGAAGLVEEGDGVDYDEAGQLIVVKKGQAVTLLSSGDILKDKLADRSLFAVKLSMEGELPVTNEYIDTVMASKPVSYWRFESIDGRQVQNEVEGAQPLEVVDEVRLSGGVQNRSLELGTAESGGHLVSDAPVPLSGTDYSVEIWCKPSHFHRGTLVAMGFEDDRKTLLRILHHAFILQTMRNDDRFSAVLRNSIPGSIRFLHRNPPTRDPRTGTSCYSTNLYQLRRWQHVVAVKKKAETRLYINGVQTGRKKDSTEIAQGLRLMIGEALFRRPELGETRPFHGQLDELAIYDRALSEKEIVKHFRTIDFSVTDAAPENSNWKNVPRGTNADLEGDNKTAYSTPANYRSWQIVN